VNFTFRLGADFAEHVHSPSTKAGDVVIWSEATVHGATPWRAARQRRIALYRFARPSAKSAIK
jgi:ectoine hydroxylase-related dioxygenase (phytanoyl-CoA dioxygenase family)